MIDKQQTPHNWVASPYGHGEWACTFCLATNREIAVIGDPNHCPDRAARGGLEYRAGNYVQAAQTDEEDDYRARIAAALDPAEAALAETRRQLLHALLPQYRADRVAIAKLCDETIDRSGRLLGELRALSQGDGQ